MKVAAHATDPDGDALTYEFDWGDDTDAVQQVGGVAAHAYPDLLGTTYTVTVRAFDGNGGEDTQTIEIEFPAPPENQPPVFDQVAILAEDGLRVTVSASAVDADDDPLTYTFDWNDDSPITTVAGGVTSHEFPAYGQYLVVVTLTMVEVGLHRPPS